MWEKKKPECYVRAFSCLKYFDQSLAFFWMFPNIFMVLSYEWRYNFSQSAQHRRRGKKVCVSPTFRRNLEQFQHTHGQCLIQAQKKCIETTSCRYWHWIIRRLINDWRKIAVYNTLCIMQLFCYYLASHRS